MCYGCVAFASSSKVCIMSRISRSITSMLTLVLCAVLLVTVSFGSHGNGQTQTRPVGKLTPAQEARLRSRQQELKAISVNIRRVARVLNAEGMQIEAGLLFTPNGRNKARAQLEAYPEMYVSRVRTEPLRGVVMADTLTLPEKVKIDSDTVIIANDLIFEGAAPVIKGSHDLHVFVFGSAKAAHGPKTVITIDTSGYGRDEWLASQALADRNSKQHVVRSNHAISPQQQPANGSDGVMGAAGISGNNGGDGVSGVSGSCSSTKDGSNGTAAGSGLEGGDGGTGTNGLEAEGASNQTVVISSVTAGSFSVIAKGGKGGNGGPGGPGGSGGTGGKGGKGGDGAGCNCNAGGLGEGGTGGAAGNGGRGGKGGKGGNGARGGAGGNIVISFPWGYDSTQVSTDYQGGSGGQGGVGGTGGIPGSYGSPGGGGHGGSVFGCDPARDGNAGSAGSGGAGGSGGDAGLPGSPGAPGSISWTVIGGPEGGGGGGGGDQYGWEPGTTYQSCTEWFLVSYHCESFINSLSPKTNKVLSNHSRSFIEGASDWACVETGRSYIGCF